MRFDWPIWFYKCLIGCLDRDAIYFKNSHVQFYDVCVCFVFWKVIDVSFSRIFLYYCAMYFFKKYNKKKQMLFVIYNLMFSDAYLHFRFCWKIKVKKIEKERNQLLEDFSFFNSSNELLYYFPTRFPIIMGVDNWVIL